MSNDKEIALGDHPPDDRPADSEALQQEVAALRQQVADLKQAAEPYQSRQRALIGVITKIRESLDLNTIFQSTAKEVQQLLEVDRVGIYRFNSDWSGEFVAESVASGWNSLLQAQSEDSAFYENISNCSVKLLATPPTSDTYLQQTAGGEFGRGEVFRLCNDIYNAGFSDCYIQALERYQARAYAIVAIYQGAHLWGLLAAYDNSAPRVWPTTEVTFLIKIGGHLGVAVQQAELLGRSERRSTVLQNRLETELEVRNAELVREADRERALAQVIDKIRRTLDLDTIFQTTATEVRQLLSVDRVAVLYFLPGSNYADSEFVAEDVLPQFTSALADKVEDHCFSENHAALYEKGHVWAIEDVYAIGLPDCYLTTLERFQVRANLVVPLIKGDQLWGLLCIHQCAHPRAWQSAEIGFVTKIAIHLGVALQQTELLLRAQHQSAELKRAKEVADAANEAKSTFLASISHELRTPLNAILGFTQLLLYDAPLRSEQQDYLEIINRSGEHLLTLINDVLEMTKIEAGRITLNENNFDFYGFLSSLEEMLQLKARSKGLQLVFERTLSVPQYIRADESKLRQVLINLLGNAIKFTQFGSVSLRVRLAPVRTFRAIDPDTPITLEFEVEDTGPGIAPGEIEKLFEAFVQSETGRNSQEGTGLGLPISRQFVRLMKGDITVTSTLGQGSIFRFEIACRPTEVDSIPPQPVKQRILGLEPDQPSYRVLVAEDKRENRQLLVKLMTEVGFEVWEVENGAEAVQTWATWRPDLIWMDMQMPVMDGFEATGQIRAREQEQTSESSVTPTKIIALTAHAFEENREQVLASGCDDYVSKPFRAEILFAKMAHHLGVRYLYADTIALPTPAIDISPPSLQAVDLAIMPAEWSVQMRLAAINLDDEKILQLVGQIPAEHDAIAAVLTDLVRNFRLDTILELTEGTAP
jgi:signal transduction histidine kinase/CheY-like chemotaxis protein